MKTKINTRVISLLLIALMVLPIMMPLMAVFAEEQTTYVLDPGTLADVSGNKPAAATDTCGTDNFFTVHYKAKTKIEANAKDFLGFTSTKRIDFQGNISWETGLPEGAVSFTTQAAATIKLFWGCTSNLSQVGVYDSNHQLLVETNEAVVANGLFTSELTVDSEGTYYVGGSTAGFYLYKMEVTTKTIDRGTRVDWNTVASPTFASVKTNEDGTVGVSVNAVVDYANGGDYLTVKT